MRSLGAADGRCVETIGSAFTFLDLRPLGRQERWEDSPPGRPPGASPTSSGADTTVRPVVTAASAVGGDRRHHFRRAEPHEAKELEELQYRSASHWEYPDDYFDWAGDARRITESYVRDNAVLVLVDSDGRKLGFYGFTKDEDGLLLDKMFLDVDQIGRGLGRVLWQHAVQTARDLGGVRVRHRRRPQCRPLLRVHGCQVVRLEADRGAHVDGADVPLHTPRQRPSAEQAGAISTMTCWHEAVAQRRCLWVRVVRFAVLAGVDGRVETWSEDGGPRRGLRWE